jgi:hypothetical protein
VLQAASLTQGGSIKGGPYSGAPLPGSPQYGILEVYDSGGPSIACRFLGMRAGDGRKMSYTFSTFNVASPQAQAFSNISTLARLATGDDSLVSGFVIPGSASRTILVRAVGPTLAQFGVADALAAPQLIVFQNGKPIVTNQAWASAPVPVNADAGNLSDPEAGDAINRLNAAFDSVGAFRLTDPTSLDAAALLTLAPGSYTIQVKSATGTAGSTLLEVYNVPQ